ncbi:oligosaccharide flippase family protein [Sodalis praecaptivus]|uniref:oligosaccharide flippase family protein n=1 Tax=Sodalis praecaptivus TaxID=1239307 RepID=UPI0027E7BCD2|nr:oligosaccharide flippase family protein [Sodalis praecaptivus]CAJ0997977.1 Teichuronic acid biosynthesis protein TuaB [Sodalis praecaptivus]
MRDIKKQAIWLFSGTCFAALMQILQLSVLARTTGARELGIIAIINSILAIAMVLQDMGMSSYLIHRQQIKRKEQSTIFWVNAMLGAMTAGLLVLMAYPLALFYKIPELTGLIALTSLNFLILGGLSQYQAHFIKIKKVVLLVRIEMFSKLIAFMLTVALLYFTPLRPAAVILGLFTNALIKLICMLYFSEKSWHPTFEFLGDTFKAALKYGSFQLGSQIINQFRTQADSLLLAKFLGPEVLGIYSLAKDLVLQPLKLLTPVINRLALPRFAEKQSSESELKKIYLNSTFAICSSSALLFLIIGIFAPTVVRIIYGAHHEQVAVLIPYMLLLGVLRPMGGLTGAITQANGKTQIEFYWNIIAGVVMLGILALALLSKNILVIASALSISQVTISFLVYPFFIKPIVDVGLLPYLRNWLPTTIVGTLIIFLINHYQLYISL